MLGPFVKVGVPVGDKDIFGIGFADGVTDGYNGDFGSPSVELFAPRLLLYIK